MKKVVTVLILLVLDFLVFLFLAFMLMNYDDSYQESQGEYWSLASMDTRDKIIYISFNAWQVLNAIAGIFFVYWVVKKIKKRATTTAKI